MALEEPGPLLEQVTELPWPVSPDSAPSHSDARSRQRKLVELCMRHILVDTLVTDEEPWSLEVLLPILIKLLIQNTTLAAKDHYKYYQHTLMSI